jgi:hypothetical protein
MPSTSTGIFHKIRHERLPTAEVAALARAPEESGGLAFSADRKEAFLKSEWVMSFGLDGFVSLAPGEPAALPKPLSTLRRPPAGRSERAGTGPTTSGQWLAADLPPVLLVVENEGAIPDQQASRSERAAHRLSMCRFPAVESPVTTGEGQFSSDPHFPSTRTCGAEWRPNLCRATAIGFEG